jgi:hypothetical protein
MGVNDPAGPAPEADWLRRERERVLGYLAGEGVRHGEVALRPDWFVLPYVAIWRVASAAMPHAVGWWVISGDVPTDYVSSRGLRGPRDAMRAIARSWQAVSGSMLRGEPHPDVSIGRSADWPELGDLLGRRARMRQDWADDDEIWGDVR